MTPAERRARNREHMRRVRAEGGRRCPACGLPITVRRQRVHPGCRRRLSVRALALRIEGVFDDPVTLAVFYQYQGA